jgi:hypothetical protein
MIFLGVLVAAAAVAVGIGLVAENTAPASLSVFGNHVPGVTSVAQVFVAGVVVAIFLMIGLAISTLAMGRSVRVRREIRDLRDEHEESLSALELEKQQLQRELARARHSRGAPVPEDVPMASQHPQGPPHATPHRPGDPVSPFFDQPG